MILIFLKFLERCRIAGVISVEDRNVSNSVQISARGLVQIHL